MPEKSRQRCRNPVSLPHAAPYLYHESCQIRRRSEDSRAAGKAFKCINHAWCLYPDEQNRFGYGCKQSIPKPQKRPKFAKSSRITSYIKHISNCYVLQQIARWSVSAQNPLRFCAVFFASLLFSRMQRWRKKKKRKPSVLSLSVNIFDFFRNHLVVDVTASFFFHRSWLNPSPRTDPGIQTCTCAHRFRRSSPDFQGNHISFKLPFRIGKRSFDFEFNLMLNAR